MRQSQLPAIFVKVLGWKGRNDRAKFSDCEILKMQYVFCCLYSKSDSHLLPYPHGNCALVPPSDPRSNVFASKYPVNYSREVGTVSFLQEGFD